MVMDYHLGVSPINYLVALLSAPAPISDPKVISDIHVHKRTLKCPLSVVGRQRSGINQNLLFIQSFNSSFHKPNRLTVPKIASDVTAESKHSHGTF